MRIALTLFLIFVIASTSYAQETNIEFNVQFKGEDLILNNTYILNGHEIKISVCKFYISNIGLNTISDTNYHLLDVENPTSLRIPITQNYKPSPICYFNIGVDSVKSVSGVFGQDLDPTNGMYWAWQSGYINCKIEGSSPQCISRKNRFQFHLGGYASPFNTLRSFSIPLKNTNGKYIINLNLDQFLESVDLSKNNRVMNPGQKAMEISSLLAKCFTANE